MGFNMHFCIIFGTNLLTEGPVQIAVFFPISVFRRKGISNGTNLCDNLSWNNATQETWSTSLEVREASTRQGACPGG